MGCLRFLRQSILFVFHVFIFKTGYVQLDFLFFIMYICFEGIVVLKNSLTFQQWCT